MGILAGVGGVETFGTACSRSSVSPASIGNLVLFAVERRAERRYDIAAGSRS